MSPGVLASLAAPLLLLPILSATVTGCDRPPVVIDGGVDGGSDAVIDATPGPCEQVFGDPGQPILLLPGQFKNEQGFEELQDGSALDLRFPTQGGQVAYVGARVTNIMGCDVRVRAELFDEKGDQIAKEERTVALVPAPGLEGYGEGRPDNTANFSNVPLCPNYVSPAFLGIETVLEVTITERVFGPDGRPVTRQGSQRLLVVPGCNEAGSPEADDRRALCECECQPGYCLGRCSEPAKGPGVCP